MECLTSCTQKCSEVDNAAGEGRLVGKQKLYSSGRCTISCAQIGCIQSERFALDWQLNSCTCFILIHRSPSAVHQLLKSIDSAQRGSPLLNLSHKSNVNMQCPYSTLTIAKHRQQVRRARMSNWRVSWDDHILIEHTQKAQKTLGQKRQKGAVADMNKLPWRWTTVY